MTQAAHKEVIKLLLKGRTITEIAEMLDVSRTTVYNRRKDFLDYAEKEGIIMATEHFEVEDTFEKLSDLSRLLERSGLEIQDAKKGIEIIDLLTSFKASNPEAFIEEVIKKSNELGITGEEITTYAAELRTLEEQENKTYKNLINEIEEKKSQYYEIEENLINIKEQIIKEKNNLENQLKESNITREKLDKFIDNIEILRSYKIELEDINKLENLIINFKQHDYDLKEIMNFYDNIIILRESIHNKREENNKLEIKNNNLKRENDNFESLLQKNMSMMSTVKSLEKMEIKPEDIFEVIKTVTNMSQGLNLTNGEAFQLFIDDLKTQYVERNDYKFQVEELKKIQQIYQTKTSLLKEEIEVLEEVVTDRKNTIDAIRTFEALDIKENDIIEWGDLIKGLGYEITSFRNMLNEISGLPSYLQLKNKEVHELEETRNLLTDEIKEYESKLHSLKQVLTLLQENIEEESFKIKQTVDDFDKYFTSPDTGFKVRSLEILDEITENLRNLLIETKNEWSTDLSTLDNNVQKIIDETDRILQNSYKGGRIVGRFHSLEPISKILREEEVSNIEGTISIITMLTYIQNWLKKNKSNEFEVFDEVIKKLMEDLGDIY